jgi:glycosyltransferase involved in cell wall biosynthesis
MRVALVVPGGVDRSGTERVIPALLWLVERLARSHEVRVFSLAGEREPRTYPLVGATVEGIGHAPSRLPGAAAAAGARRLTASLKAHGPFDVLHAFWADAPGLLAAAAGRFLGIPWIVHLGGGELAALPEIGYGSALTFRGRLRTRLALAGAARVTAASRFLAEKARARGIEVEEVPLGVPRSWLEDTRPAQPGPPFTLVHVGSLNLVKDQATLLRAFRRVAGQEPAVRLELAGDDTLSGEMQRLAASLGLGERVAFHGAMPSERVRELFVQAHLHVVSSRHEAGPVAAVEAAALGVPTVGTAVGHVADWAPAMASAVPVGDDEALARAILELLADEPRRRAMGERARAWTEEHDADAAARSFTRLYEEAARSHRERRSR